MEAESFFASSDENACLHEHLRSTAKAQNRSSDSGPERVAMKMQKISILQGN